MATFRLEDLEQLAHSQSIVVPTLGVRVVDPQIRGLCGQDDAPAAARLHRVNRPAPAILRAEYRRVRAVDRMAAEDRLTGCGRLVTATLAQLLKFCSEYPVHAEIVAEIARHVAVSAASAISIDLLE